MRRVTAIRASVLTVCAAVTVGVWAWQPDGRGPVRPAAPTSTQQAASVPVIGAGPQVARPSRRFPAPAYVRIPAIGVNTALQQLGLEPDGSLQAPTAWDVAGWYAGGPRPGEPGPAVIVGHIDSLSGPAVFFRLRELRPGAAVFVGERGGGVLRFVVDDVETFAKAHFPTSLVYGPQPIPVLRLITCTGAFDTSAGSYLDNLVISAHCRSRC